MAKGYIPLISLSILLVCFALTLEKLQAADLAATSVVAQPSPDVREKKKNEPQSTPSSQSDQAVYSLVLRNKTPKLNAGETVQVEIYLSGYGTPARNKLHIQWSSDDVIDKNQPGVLQAWLNTWIDKATMRQVPFKLDKPQEVPLVGDGQQHSAGLTIHLCYGTFLRPPCADEPENDEFGLIASEGMWEDKAPVMLNLQTSSDAPSGDYEITFTFTYADGHGLLQDQKVVPFHIRDWQERNTWIVPSAFIIAFISLLVTALGTVYQFFFATNKPCHRIGDNSDSL